MHLCSPASMSAWDYEGFFFDKCLCPAPLITAAGFWPSGPRLFINISGCQEQRDRDTPLLLQISYFPYKRALCMCTCIFPQLHTWDINTRDLKWANADFNLSGIIPISSLPKTVLDMTCTRIGITFVKGRPGHTCARPMSGKNRFLFFLGRITIHLMQNWVNVYLDFFFYPVQHCVNMVIAAI